MLTEEKKYFLLSEAPVFKSLLYMVIPTLCIAVITELNTAIDAFFLKHVSIYASSAVTISWPIMCIMLAISYTLSLGSSIKAGHCLGEKKSDEARSMVSTTVWITIWSNIITVLLLMIKLKTVILFFGADKNTLPYTFNYLKVMLPAMIFQDLAYIAAMYLRAEGNSAIVLWAMILQTVSNIFWNIVFVIHLHWGASGAALASMISFIFQCIVLYSFLCSRRSLLRISVRLIKINATYFKTVISYGLSGFCMLIMFSLGQFVMNREASELGSDYLAANTVLIFLLSLAFSITMGVTDGAEPLMAYSFGARNKHRLLHVVKWLGIFTSVIGLLLAIAMLFFSEQLSSLFTSNQSGIALAKAGVHISGIAMLFMPLIAVLGSMSVSMGRGIMAAVMNSIRQGMVVLFVLTLSHYWGGRGLVVAQPLAMIAGSILLVAFIPAIISRVRHMPESVKVL